MAIISLANAKGGAGKTTAALILATELARQGNRVVILDADPQRWITNWSELTGALPNITVISEVTTASLPYHILDLKAKTDYFVIDLAGARDALVTTALGLSDHVLIPVQGCAMDARGAAQILDLIRMLEEKAGISIPHSVVLTRVSAMVTTRGLQTIKGLLATRGVNVLNTMIAERTAYRDIFDCGGNLYGMDPQRISNLDRAQENAQALAAEVRSLLPARSVAAPKTRSFFRIGRQAA
ncbi:ParA family protein [Gellertiella hungarica]|uniref:Chromosome partitioning protein n=1 Tax=Gellertiella hungarica TaxID=1572859 RepID=A0A7W6J2C6_9HYPH|nr:ParA family protein [Gellertiella hungarica]MBB4063484.1 chromosome partitioning protein [Gellertiella hungarica]